MAHNLPYIIRCITPLHVGSGDSHYGVIDNLVQRDPITNMPMIHQSSLKGALREHFDYKTWRDEVFGPEKGNNSSANSGSFYFDAGMLLSLPVRSNKIPFFRATSPEIVADFIEKNELFRNGQHSRIKNLLQRFTTITQNAIVLEPSLAGAMLEEEDIITTVYTPAVSAADKTEIEKIFGKNLVIIRHELFQFLYESLPVIARNKLDNGKSKNLWYEETVPRESRFFTFFVADKQGSDFEKEITTSLVQIGGNATIGYGKCQFLTY